MGCIVSKSVPANKYVLKQPNKSGKELSGTSNTLLELYTEEYIAYGPEFIERMLLRFLGVVNFQEKQIPVKFEEKPQSEQEHILRLIYMYMNLQDFKQDSLVIEALRETKFVTNGDGDLYKPKDLFDPCDSLLPWVFSGEANKFPGERFKSGGWLNILRKTGLQNTGDADTVLECARKIEMLGTKSKKHLGLAAHNKLDFLKSTNEVSIEIWSLAETLLTLVLKNIDVLYGNNSFCNSFGKIACIPAETGFPFESGKKRGKRVLCSYSDAILLKDSHLAWSVAPILYKESLVPPEYSWGALQLRSPPPFTIVHKHLKGVRLTESSFLTIEDATVEVLQYLERIWNTLSSSDIQKLRKLRFIPVANSTYLVKPVCISCHPKVDLFPLSFELPSRYQPFIKILKELCLHDTLSVSSAMSTLSHLHKYRGYERLCPNTLRGVIELLNFVFNETIDQQKSDGFNLESKLVVPNESCRLVYPNTCVYIDPYGSQYVKYAESLKLTFVHHDVSERLCFSFGVRKLSDVVIEELDCTEPLQTLVEIGSVSLDAIRQKLLNSSFQIAVSKVFISNCTIGSRNPNFQAVKKSLELIAERLQFVQCIYTRSWLLPEYSLDITHVSKESNVIKAWGSRFSHRVPCYIDRSNTCMLIAKPPGDVSVLDLVAIVVSHVLGSPIPLPIASLFLCPKDSKTTLINIQKVPSHKRVMDTVGCGNGFLGKEVHPEDAKKASFFRVRPFYRGQIVAWRSHEVEKLKYGRIPEDVRPAEQALREVKVETSPGKTKTVKSSLVYMFVYKKKGD